MYVLERGHNAPRAKITTLWSVPTSLDVVVKIDMDDTDKGMLRYEVLGLCAKAETALYVCAGGGYGRERGADSTL